LTGIASGKEKVMPLRSITSFAAAVLIATGSVVFAATPTPTALVAAAVDAAETQSSMDLHNMIRLAVQQEETTSDGTTEATEFTAVVHGSRVENARVVLSHGVSLAMSGTTGWAMIRGELDSRPQTPQMAAGTIRQMIFPLVMPFSLQMEGVTLGRVVEGSFDRTPAWVLDVTYESGFFAAPSMVAPWLIFISREDNLVLGAQYLPPPEFRSVIDEGIRYRVLSRQDVDGVNLPAQILMEGIDFNGVENGHVRITKIAAETVDPLDLSLFISPAAADKLDEGVF
jgi:hypothetical protein